MSFFVEASPEHLQPPFLELYSNVKDTSEHIQAGPSCSGSAFHDVHVGGLIAADRPNLVACKNCSCYTVVLWWYQYIIGNCCIKEMLKNPLLLQQDACSAANLSISCSWQKHPSLQRPMNSQRRASAQIAFVVAQKLLLQIAASSASAFGLGLSPVACHLQNSSNAETPSQHLATLSRTRGKYIANVTVEAKTKI